MPIYTMDAVFSIHKKVVCDSKGDVQTTVCNNSL